MIAKLINGNIYPCPKQGRDGRGRYHSNLPSFYEKHHDVASKDGYYPIKYTAEPPGYYTSSWVLSNDEITQVWTERTPEQEQEDPILSRIEMLEECILEMSEYVYA